MKTLQTPRTAALIGLLFLTLLLRPLHGANRTEGGPVDQVPERIPDGVKALVMLDARLHALISRELNEYVSAASRRRKFPIAVLPVENLDDCPPQKLREVLRTTHAKHPGVEGVLFAGNVKVPSF